MNFWDFLWLIIWSFFFVAYLIVLFQIILDLFRDKDLSGVLKAVWLIALLIFPLITGLIYLIVRGRGMAERHAAAARAAREATDSYIQSGAAKPTAADEISSAKALLDNGTITQAEFDQLKAKALA